jgi:hypothetical protein
VLKLKIIAETMLIKPKKGKDHLDNEMHKGDEGNSTTGNEMISQQENPVATGICHSCGHCVIAYTGGICPLSECPAESKYGPCNKAPENGLQCAIVPEQNCIWKEIEKTADLATLEELSYIHKSEENKILPLVGFS